MRNQKEKSLTWKQQPSTKYQLVNPFFRFRFLLFFLSSPPRLDIDMEAFRLGLARKNKEKNKALP